MTDRSSSVDNELSDFSSREQIVAESEGFAILKAPKGWGTRHTIALMAFLGSVVSYSMRINMSMAIVSMTSKNASSAEESTCPIPESQNNTSSENEGEFSWSAAEQGLILSAFFWGYVLPQIHAGFYAEKYGAKWIFGIGLLVTAILQLLTPVMTRWGGKTALIVSRVIQGFGEGVTPPATHALLAQWSPPLERSKLGSFVYAGNQGGTVCAMLFSGMIINAGIFDGWPGVFYIFGVVGLIWFALWCFLVYSSPLEHPRISKEELHYIEGSKGGQTAKEKLPTPWRSLIRSKPVWAIMFAQLGNGWGLYTLLTMLPTYMNSILHFDMKQNSLLSALPYFVMLVCALVISYVADVLREKKILSTTWTRKLFNTMGHWIPAFALIGAAYTGCDKVLTVALLTVAVGAAGAVGAGYQINHVDIAANHAGVLMGICNGIANLAGIASPYVAGALTKKQSDITGWRIVFFLSAGIYFVDNLIYLIFGSGVEQPWNRIKPEEVSSKLQVPTYKSKREE